MGVLAPTTATIKTKEVLSLRSATRSDAAAVYDFIRVVLAERAYTVTLPDELERGVAGTQDRLEQFESDAGKLIILAHATDRTIPPKPGSQPSLVGELSLWSETRSRLAHNCTIGLSVAAPCRGRGIGRALIQAALVWARTHPTLEKVNLSVFGENTRAIHLYESLGFVHEGVRRNHIRTARGAYSDDVMMSQWVKDRG